MGGFGDFVGALVGTVVTVFLIVFLADKLVIWEICAFWDTSCPGVVTEQKHTAELLPRATQAPTRKQEPARQEKEDNRSGLPSELLPQITIGPWTLNKRHDPQSGGQLSSDFIGSWTGNVIQSGFINDRLVADKYSAFLTVGPARVNERVGRVHYKPLNCGGGLFLVSAPGTQITLEERLTYGQNRCVDRTVINLTTKNDGTLDYSVSNDAYDVTATGILKKPR